MDYPTAQVIRHFEFGSFVSLFIIFYTDYPTTRVIRHFFLGPLQCRIIRVTPYLKNLNNEIKKKKSKKLGVIKWTFDSLKLISVRNTVKLCNSHKSFRVHLKGTRRMQRHTVAHSAHSGTRQQMATKRHTKTKRHTASRESPGGTVQHNTRQLKGTQRFFEKYKYFMNFIEC